jgi:hypothetical protein
VIYINIKTQLLTRTEFSFWIMLAVGQIGKLNDMSVCPSHQGENMTTDLPASLRVCLGRDKGP